MHLSSRKPNPLFFLSGRGKKYADIFSEKVRIKNRKMMDVE